MHSHKCNNINQSHLSAQSLTQHTVITFCFFLLNFFYFYENKNKELVSLVLPNGIIIGVAD